MANYPYKMQLVVDPDNPRNIVAAGVVSIYDSEDLAKTTLLALTDPNGVPIPNPITSNANGFTPPFVTTSPEVLWVSGAYTDFFQSYQGMRDEAVAARAAAETAAATAGAEAAVVAESAIGDATADATAAAASAATAASNAASSATAAANAAALVGAPADTAMATVANNAGSAFRGALNATIASSSGLNVKTQFGAVGNGTADDTAAIQAAINAAAPGQAIIFPNTGSGSFYKITDKLTVTTPNLRLIGQPRDGYAMSIRCAVASKVMIEVKAPGFVMQDIALFGDSSATNGAGATVVGLDLYGDTDGNIDSAVRGSTFQGLAIGARTRGRNAMFAADSIFSNCLKGVVIAGKDATYHTGPNADQNRGNTVRACRFHNIGNASTDAAIEITVAAKVLHATFENNFFDSNGAGRHIVATGDVTNPCKGLTISGNKHTEAQADVYALTYVNNSTVRAADIAGNAGVGGSLSNGIVANNCDTLRILDVFGLQLGQSGIYARNCTNLHIRNVHFRAIGTDSGTTGHGFDIDSTNTNCNFDNISVEGTDGWGLTGSPATVKLGRYAFKSCTLGGINSTTLIADQVYLPAAQMTAVTGTPNLIGLPGVGYPLTWQMDPAAVELVTGSLAPLPNDWETFDAYIVWAATDTQAGAVVWDLNYAFIVEGAVPSASNVANPGAAQNSPGVSARVNRYKIAAGKTRGTAPMVIRVDRNAAAGADTYPADAALLGVQLVRAS